MKRLFGGLLGALFDLRVIVGVCGLLLSVVMHELFHVIMHWGEITSVHLFTSPHTIVEIAFTPTHEYNLATEELFAYGISGLTILLTAMLIHDIHDQRDTRSVEQIVLAKDYRTTNTLYASRYLSVALGVDTTRHS